MKYIRTKDSIDLLIKSIDSYIVKDSESSFEKAIDEETLLKNYKVADTIEELCDEFIAYNHKASLDVKDVFSIKEELNYALDYMEEGYTIYGAVWTDKGLIYVAKMNEKGDLELL